MTRRFGKQTSPGFADPSLPVSLDPRGDDAGISLPDEKAPPQPHAPEERPEGYGGRDQRDRGEPEEEARRGTPEPLIPDPAEPRGRLPARPNGRTPMVEVEVSYERGPAPSARPLRRWLEVWTRNSVYVVDAHMRCLEVRATGSGEAIADHPFVNTRLVGGQWHGDDGVELSYPLPRPGSCAVFEGRRGKKRRFSRTSAVERVVMRLQVVAVTAPNVVPNWEDLVDATQYDRSPLDRSE